MPAITYGLTNPNYGTSGTYSFRLDVGQAVLQAFAMNGYSPESVQSTDMELGKTALNLVFSDWASRGNMLFEVDLQIQPLSAGQTSFSLPAGTVDVYDATLRNTVTNNGLPLDAPFLVRISRSEYMMKPDKQAQGIPTQYWVDRQYIPVMYVYQTPANGTYQIAYYRVKQIQDVVNSAENFDVPYRWQAALVRGLAVEVALFKKNYPALPALQDLYQKAYDTAAMGEGDMANMRVEVDMSRYTKR